MTSLARNITTTPRIVGAVTVGLMLGLTSAAQAQTNESKWSIDVGIGWDNSIAGNINSSTIGSINNQTVVILTNQYRGGLWHRASFQGGRRLHAQPDH